jgi:hypothetical protein
VVAVNAESGDFAETSIPAATRVALDWLSTTCRAGHRRIAYLRGPVDIGSATPARWFPVRCDAAGLDADETPVRIADPSMVAGEFAAEMSSSRGLDDSDRDLQRPDGGRRCARSMRPASAFPRM